MQKVKFISPKDTIPIVLILEKYGLMEKLTYVSENQLRGPCPLHGGRNPQAFSVRLDTNRWKCYTGCGRGSIIDIVMKMEDCNVSRATTILNRFAKEKPGAVREATRREEEAQLAAPPKIVLPLTGSATVYLKTRGISYSTGKFFGFGIVKAGTLKDRLIIPIHWEDGSLIGWTTRDIQTPGSKYIMRRNIPRRALLFNLHRQPKGGLGIVVEGYMDTAKIWQAGFRNVVATLGTEVTNEQVFRINTWFKEVVVLYDGDEAGYEATESLMPRIKVRKRAILLAEGDPAAHADNTPRTDKEIRELLRSISKEG